MFCGSLLEFIWSSCHELVHASCEISCIVFTFSNVFEDGCTEEYNRLKGGFQFENHCLKVGDIIKCITQIITLRNMKENQLYYSPWSCSCDVICSWKYEAIVFSKFSCGEVVANALHHNVDIAKRKSSHCLSHIAMDTYMDLKRSTS